MYLQSDDCLHQGHVVGNSSCDKCLPFHTLPFSCSKWILPWVASPKMWQKELCKYLKWGGSTPLLSWEENVFGGIIWRGLARDSINRWICTSKHMQNWQLEDEKDIWECSFKGASTPLLTWEESGTTGMVRKALAIESINRWICQSVEKTTKNKVFFSTWK